LRRIDQRGRCIGARITIHDNCNACAHAGICTDLFKRAFRLSWAPWRDPDGAAPDVIGTVSRCPSGALNCTIEDADGPEPTQVALETVSRDGRYMVSGGIELIGQTFGEGASPDRATLCRCGASKNKPLCDGSQWHVGFKDSD
jgi:uncharacterized Fe-S cluster protein YjdI